MEKKTKMSIWKADAARTYPSPDCHPSLMEYEMGMLSVNRLREQYIKARRDEFLSTKK